MKHRIRHGAKITCDVPGCDAFFLSYSRASIVRTQAAYAKWSHTHGVDECPIHAGGARLRVLEAKLAEREIVLQARYEARVLAAHRKLLERLAVISAAHAKIIAKIPRVLEAVSRAARRVVRGIFKTEPVAPGDVSVELAISVVAVEEPTYDRARWPAPIVALSDRADADRASVEPAAPAPDEPPPREPRAPRARLAPPTDGVTATFAVVLSILREAAQPLSAREIVERAGDRLPSKSKTPHTVVSRDLAIDVARHGDASRVVRVGPGRFTLREGGSADA